MLKRLVSRTEEMLLAEALGYLVLIGTIAVVATIVTHGF